LPPSLPTFRRIKFSIPAHGLGRETWQGVYPKNPQGKKFLNRARWQFVWKGEVHGFRTKSRPKQDHPRGTPQRLEKLRTYELGVTSFDTAEVYGPSPTKNLWAKRFFLSARRWSLPRSSGPTLRTESTGLNSRPERIRQVAEEYDQTKRHQVAESVQEQLDGKAADWIEKVSDQQYQVS
jgi:hypothetical protein